MRKPVQQATQWGMESGRFRMIGQLPQKHRRLPAGVYGISSDMGGWFLQPAAIVTDALIEVPSEPINRVMGRVEQFRHAREAYKNFGLLYKTGILMYGPAGCGKTAVVRDLATRFVAADAVVLQAVQASDFTGNVLQGIRRLEPKRLIVVEMEDIDAIVEYDEEGLLSLLDGSHQIDGVVYLATTNKIQELPDRIKNRPSRIDDRVYVGPPDLACRTKYLVSKWPASQWDSRVEHIAGMTGGFSYAHLKEVVVAVGCLGHEPDETIRRLRMTVEPEPDEYKQADEKFLAGVGVKSGVGVTSGVGVGA